MCKGEETPLPPVPLQPTRISAMRSKGVVVRNVCASTDLCTVGLTPGKLLDINRELGCMIGLMSILRCGVLAIFNPRSDCTFHGSDTDIFSLYAQCETMPSIDWTLLPALESYPHQDQSAVLTIILAMAGCVNCPLEWPYEENKVHDEPYVKHRLTAITSKQLLATLAEDLNRLEYPDLIPVFWFDSEHQLREIALCTEAPAARAVCPDRVWWMIAQIRAHRSARLMQLGPESISFFY